MTAGKPDYQKLYDMGKLPPESRHLVPGLAQQDNLQKELDTIKSILCENCKAKLLELSKPKEKQSEELKERITGAQKIDTGVEPAALAEPIPINEVKVRCPGFQCEYIAVGKSEAVAQNNLRLHQKGKHPEMFKGEEKK